MSRWSLFSAVPLVLALAAAACAPAAPAARPAEPAARAPQSSAPAAAPAAQAPAPAAAPVPRPVTLKVGLIGIIPDSAVHIANQRGYFKEQGITVEVVPFSTGGQMVAPLATGDLHVGFGALSAALFNAMQRDIPIRMASDAGRLPPGAGSTIFAVRKDLVDGGQYRDLPDLKGRSVAVTANANGTYIAFTRLLTQAGLTASDVETPFMGASDMVVAFRSNAIDAAVIVEPLATIAAQQGLAVKARHMGDFHPNQQIGLSLYGGELTKDPDAGKRFMHAYLRGIRDYTDAFFQNKGKDEVIKLILEAGLARDPSIFDGMSPEVFNPDGYVNVESVVADYQWYVDNGFVQNPIDPRMLIDNQYVDYALEKLGRYR
jgi:NitT/TauT family transport system substrate-binding protein